MSAHLAAVTRLCSEEPSGHRVVELSRAEFWDDDGTARAAAAEQYEAERTALIRLLAPRWGEPQWIGLQGVRIRAGEGESIPEPWLGLSWMTPDVYLWRADDRWLAVGVTHGDGETLLRLVAVATTVDPP
ncbi:hypothetical protein [Streptomyces sp. NPDC002851]